MSESEHDDDDESQTEQTDGEDALPVVAQAEARLGSGTSSGLGFKSCRWRLVGFRSGRRETVGLED